MMSQRRKTTSSTLWAGPGRGFISKFGPKDEDWEEAPAPDHGLDDYEIGKMHFRRSRK